MRLPEPRPAARHATTATLLGGAIPVLTALLGEPLSGGQLGGGALVIAGVWLAASQAPTGNQQPSRQPALAVAAPGR